MATRRITGVVRNIQDLPWTNAKILFELLAPSFTADTQYPISLEEVRTDTQGQVSVDLWCSSSGLAATAYRCTMPDSEQFTFTLEVGLPLTFTQIRTIGVPASQSSASLMAYVSDQVTAQVSAQVAAIGIGGGGGGTGLANIILPFADNQTVFTLSVLPILPQKTMLFVNGVKYEYLQDYTLVDYVLTWLNLFSIKSVYRIQFYY